MPMLTKSRKSRPTNTQTSTISNVLSDSTTNMSDRNNGTTTKRTRTVISQPNVDSENESDDEGRQHKRKRGKQIHSDDDEGMYLFLHCMYSLNLQNKIIFYRCWF